MKYAKFLNDGDSIAIIAPSDGANLKYLDNAILNLKEIGFKVCETKDIRNSKYLVSTDAKARASEFLKVFCNNGISHIIAAGGGEFLIDILPYIYENKEKIQKNQKIKYVQGFSDISLLNFYITTNFDIATINANNIGDFATKKMESSNMLTIEFLRGKYGDTLVQNSYEKYQSRYTENKNEGYKFDKNVVYKSLDNKSRCEFSGRIIGGCVDVLTQIIGTKYDNTTKFCKSYGEGQIWYFDNAELSSVELYRRLKQIREVGWLKYANGILFGRRTSETIIEDFTYEVAMKKALEGLNIPVIYDVDIGHVMPQFTIINGSYATFSYSNGAGTLVQKLI